MEKSFDLSVANAELEREIKRDRVELFYHFSINILGSSRRIKNITS